MEKRGTPGNRESQNESLQREKAADSIKGAYSIKEVFNKGGVFNKGEHSTRE